MSVIMSLRQAVIQRVQNSSDDELKAIIQDSIGGDDKVLPGLGVLFEIIWEFSDEDVHKKLVHTLAEHLRGQTAEINS